MAIFFCYIFKLESKSEVDKIFTRYIFGLDLTCYLGPSLKSSQVRLDLTWFKSKMTWLAHLCIQENHVFINKALRLQDISTLLLMRFFIKDLYDQLLDLYHLLLDDNSMNYKYVNGIWWTEFYLFWKWERIKHYQIKEQFVHINKFHSVFFEFKSSTNFTWS